MERFAEVKKSLRLILSDRNWLVKILLSGCLLINPILVILTPLYLSAENPEWLDGVYLSFLALNVATFLFPLGFIFEALRRARKGEGNQLPEWNFSVLSRYAREGGVKFVIAIFTLILPVLLWTSFCYVLFVGLFCLPPSMLALFGCFGFWAAVPFCGVACCRWIDGAGIWNSALNYAENYRLFRKKMTDYLIASAFLTGLSAIANSFFYTLPFVTVFGLCLANTWFGAIYAESVSPMPERKF